jgi:hypothetical protein
MANCIYVINYGNYDYGNWRRWNILWDTIKARDWKWVGKLVLKNWGCPLSHIFQFEGAPNSGTNSWSRTPFLTHRPPPIINDRGLTNWATAYRETVVISRRPALTTSSCINTKVMPVYGTLVSPFSTEGPIVAFFKTDQGWVDYNIFVVRYNYSYFKNM